MVQTALSQSAPQCEEAAVRTGTTCPQRLIVKVSPTAQEALTKVSEKLVEIST